ncbi:MAG TPA: CopD family protein [Kofleriaceae bacterium]|nr:CopD family protein [Kofleriaceae bacterium]
MSMQTMLWFRVLHVVGFVLWIAGLWAAIWLLKVHTQVDASSRPALVAAERKVGASMDAGATFAIIAGFVMAFAGPINAFKTGGWLHIKLTLIVVGLLSIHGLVRVKMRKVRNGDLQPLPGWVVPVCLVVVLAVIALGANPTLLRKVGGL